MAAVDDPVQVQKTGRVRTIMFPAARVQMFVTINMQNLRCACLQVSGFNCIRIYQYTQVNTGL